MIQKTIIAVVFMGMMLTACTGETGAIETEAIDGEVENLEAEAESEDDSQEARSAGELDAACLGKDAAFAAFAEQLHIYCDDVYMYIEAESLAEHEMMVGITAWNQQVPIPQAFHEENAWRIPLHPVMAESSRPTTGQGPIGVAINGVMIYDPTQQDGIYDERRDPYLIGELDGCGGHSGRADDYHYHIAPVCLLGELSQHADGELPIAYALDGFPIYGFVQGLELDECRGAFDEDGNYGYYASAEFPYVNGCFKGEVDFSLQPATHPIRPAGEPIEVLITALYEDDEGWMHLEYEYEGSTQATLYRLDAEGCYNFQFIKKGEGRSETYCGSAPPGPN